MGATTWNQWRYEQRGPLTPDLSKTNLSGTDLSGANFTTADLTKAKLIGANLCESGGSGAKLTMADLTGANLTGAHLTEANFTQAKADRCLRWSGYRGQPSICIRNEKRTRTRSLHVNRISMSLAICILGMQAMPQVSLARDYVIAVGSSTVYPFATAVAERVGKTTKFRAPHIEAFGSGGGIRLFCGGIGPDHPDIALTSRQMKASEVEHCRQRKVNDILEIKLGHDGIVVASAKESPPFSLAREDIYLALGREVPDPNNGEKLVENPYQTWKQVRSNLPDIPIRVYGPPPTSGTRDVFVELAMQPGCRSLNRLGALRDANPEQFQRICQSMREDGAYIEAGENDNLIIQKLRVDEQALGIFGFSFYDQNSDTIQVAEINGVEPTWETIFEHAYPLSRPLFIYTKKAHIDRIPGLKAFLAELTDEKTWGEEGYLVDKGLIPLTGEERKRYADRVKALN
jgi:phosphate transport system substrate-binding protein